ANIVRNWPETPIYATIDREKIKQALLNVMLNAIQSMEHGGTLTVNVLPQADEIVIELRDEGAGIPPECAKRIFDPFFTTRPNGTGLGLAITKKIVDLHQGSISVDSEPGRGTCVRIELPVTSKPSPDAVLPA
ncbi:MAG TPA: ATP-binding protein, partial [Candidatus Ozemobacteraceae bacterium]|nr:ATP-binding protein [Candidatus Ozemobacteraceae bacterium]